jgi:glucose/arabinose dehydrogenase
MRSERDFLGLRAFQPGNPSLMPLRLSALAAAVTAIALGAPPASAALHLSQVGSGFSSPVYVAAPPSDPHRVFVVERVGKIFEVRDGQKLDTPFLDITRDVKSGGEEGLLSMAFAPDYATSGRFYVFYTAPRAGDGGGNVGTVEEFGPTGRHILFTVDHPDVGNHNAGQLQFGRDGLLYVTTGDGGGGNDPGNDAQNTSSRLGKVLRIDPRVAGATPQMYAYGLRNPFRFSFDRQTGDLIIADVGQGQREEVDFSASGTPPGTNYGWSCFEGSQPTPGLSTPCNPDNDVLPVLEKVHSDTGFCAIIGGYVVRNASLPELNGRYVYGDNCNTHVRAVTLPAASGDSDTGLNVPGLSSFGEDSCGHIYATAVDNTSTSVDESAVFRIDGDAFTPCPEPPPGPDPGGGGGGGNPPPDPGGGDPSPPSPPADTRAPHVTIGSLRRQPALRLRGFRLSVRCDELCGATITGTVRVRGSKRTYVLARVARQLAANKPVKLTLRASNRLLRAIRRHRHATATLKVVARDPAGNATTARRKVLASR